MKVYSDKIVFQIGKMYSGRNFTLFRETAHGDYENASFSTNTTRGTKIHRACGCGQGRAENEALGLEHEYAGNLSTDIP